MYKNLRLVVLDYPKLIIRDDKAMKILADMVQAKQINFERSDETYVPLGGLDMISTHFMIYDTTDMLSPKPILALRNCYEDRCKKHNIPLPIDYYIEHTPPEMKKKFLEFKKNKPLIVDCNAWFVDPNYSFKATGWPLSDIGFFMVAMHIFRRRLDHLVGIANERFKASRWVEPIGEFPKGMLFKHPMVGVDHLLILLEPFNKDWFVESYKKYGELFKKRYEVAPDNSISKENLLSDIEMEKLIEKWSDDSKSNVRELHPVARKRVAS